jgi:sugar phosphate isomerase/epimerase
MIKSSVTISLVPGTDDGPFLFSHDLEECCQQARRIGFDAVEVLPESAEQIDSDAFTKTLDKHNLKLAALGTGGGYRSSGLHLCDPDPERRRKAVEFISRIMEVAGAFGALVIIGSMQGRIPPEIDRPTAEGWLREGLDSLGALAGKRDVNLLLEPLNRYETNCVNRLEQGVALIESLVTERIALLADLFHMNIEEQSIPDALRSAGAHVRHVHFVDSNRRPAGCGHLDFQVVAEALCEIDFHGYASAEALPHPTSREAAEQTMRSFKKFLTTVQT